jgi:hypothetical protein
MTPTGMLETAVLLGVYVLLAGSYALLYTLARLRNRQSLSGVALVLFVLHCLVAAAIVMWTALGPGWKALLIASSVAIYAIPPFTWRYLEHTHDTRRAAR